MREVEDIGRVRAAASTSTSAASGHADADTTSTIANVQPASSVVVLRLQCAIAIRAATTYAGTTNGYPGCDAR